VNCDFLKLTIHNSTLTTIIKMIIDAISPLDGRYAGKLVPHRNYFSEKGLMYYRCKVELLYVLALDEAGLFEPLNDTEKANIQDCIDNFTDADYKRIKEIEFLLNNRPRKCLGFKTPNQVFLEQSVALAN